MTRLSKTAAALTVLLFGAITTNGRAQQPDDGMRPSAGMRGTQRGKPVAPSRRQRLSDETLRSLREMPAGTMLELPDDPEDTGTPHRRPVLPPGTDPFGEDPSGMQAPTSGRTPQRGEPGPRPRRGASADSVQEGRASSPGAGAGQRRLSDEAMRSLREKPPGYDPEFDPLMPSTEPAEPEMPPLPQRTRPAIPEGNPFEDLAVPQAQTGAGPVKLQQRPEYIIEPPDLVVVEVLEALPGRPISGERLVRPDGRISLGFYGEIPAAGCTINQLKERIVLHLRKFINDEVLGLVERDLNTGELKRDPENPAEIWFKDPRETDRVFVDVTAYNSVKVYVMGDVLVGGILPYTGGDTVLDLIELAGGLLPSADQDKIRLIRSFPRNSPARVLPIDYKQIAMGTDSSTNYEILPGDRLVIPRLKIVEDALQRQRESAVGLPQPTGRPRSDQHMQPSLYFNRRTPLPPTRPNEELEKRIEELEQKLDTLIEAVEKLQPKPAEMPEPPRGEADGDGRPTPENLPSEEAAPPPSRPRRGPADRSPRTRRRGTDENRPGPSRPRPDAPRAETPF